MNQPLTNTLSKENLLAVFEKMMNMRTYFSSFMALEEIKRNEDNGSPEGKRLNNGLYQQYDFRTWVMSYYLKQADIICQQIKRITRDFDNQEKIKTFINQQYGFVKALLKKNADLRETFTLGDDDKIIRTGLFIGLKTLKGFIEEDYETFLDNNDRHKIAFADFVHEILHHFSDLNHNIYIKKHKPDCKSGDYSLKEVEKSKPEKLLDFQKHYQFIVKNWITENKDLGNNYSERDFINYALNNFDTLIKPDSSSGNFIGEDHQMEKYEFAPEFYQLHLVPLFDSLKKLLINKQKKLELINDRLESKTKIKLRTFLTVPQLAYIFKLLAELKPDIFDVKSKAELQRFISANFSTKGTTNQEISTDKLKQLFSDPDPDAAEFWRKHFLTMLAETKKFN